MSYVDVTTTHISEDVFFIELKQNAPKGLETVGKFIMLPKNAKAFCKSLQLLIEQYETKHGKITEVEVRKVDPKKEGPEWKGIT